MLCRSRALKPRRLQRRLRVVNTMAPAAAPSAARRWLGATVLVLVALCHGVPAVDVITSISTHAIAVRSLPTITFTAPPTAISNYARIGFSTSVSCSDLVVVQVFNASQITFTSSFTLDQKNQLYYVCFTSKIGAVPWVAQVGLGQIQTFDVDANTITAYEPPVIGAGIPTQVTAEGLLPSPTSRLLLYADAFERACTSVLNDANQLKVLVDYTTAPVTMSLQTGTYRTCLQVDGTTWFPQNRVKTQLRAMSAGTNTVKQLDPDLVPVDRIVQFTVPYEAVGAPTAILAFPAPGEACNETSLHAYPVNSTHFEVAIPFTEQGTYHICYSINNGTTWLLQTDSRAKIVAAARPDPVGSLAAAAFGPNYINVTWAAGEDNLGPILHYELSITDGATVTTVTTLDAGTWYEFNGLLAETEYNISVAAVNVAGAGPAVTVSTTTGRAVASVSGPPTDVQWSFSTATDTTLTWTPPVNTGGVPLLGYQIVLQLAAAGTEVHSDIVGPDVTSITYTDLQPSTAYTALLLAQNEKGWSSPEYFEFVTASVGAPTAPLNLHVFSLSGSVVSLHWDPPASTGNLTISDYIVTYSVDSVAAPDLTTGGRARAWIESLQGFSVYIVSVVAVNSEGHSPPSEAITFASQAGSVSLWLSNNTTTFIIIVAVSSGVTIIGALLLFWRTFIVRWQRRARRKSLADADTQTAEMLAVAGL